MTDIALTLNRDFANPLTYEHVITTYYDLWVAITIHDIWWKQTSCKTSFNFWCIIILASLLLGVVSALLWHSLYYPCCNHPYPQICTRSQLKKKYQYGKAILWGRHEAAGQYSFCWFFIPLCLNTGNFGSLSKCAWK